MLSGTIKQLCRQAPVAGLYAFDESIFVRLCVLDVAFIHQLRNTVLDKTLEDLLNRNAQKLFEMLEMPDDKRREQLERSSFNRWTSSSFNLNPPAASYQYALMYNERHLVQICLLVSERYHSWS